MRSVSVLAAAWLTTWHCDAIVFEPRVPLPRQLAGRSPIGDNATMANDLLPSKLPAKRPPFGGKVGGLANGLPSFVCGSGAAQSISLSRASPQIATIISVALVPRSYQPSA